jgi:hypothetical protein
MKKTFDVSGRVSKFPGKGGWYYVSVPKKYTERLKEKRPAWGMYPIRVRVGNTSWATKLMTKKGGDFFVAFNKKVRDKEKIIKSKRIKVSVTLIFKK